MSPRQHVETLTIQRRNGWRKWIAIIGVLVLVPGAIGTFWGQIARVVKIVDAPDDIRVLRAEMNARFDTIDHRFDRLEQKVDVLRPRPVARINFSPGDSITNYPPQ